MTKSKKYSGVYYNTLQNGDKSYYITFKDDQNKKQRIKIGLHSSGIREAYCHQKRNEIVNKLRLGEQPPEFAKRTKQNSLTLNDMFNFYIERRAMKDRTRSNYKGKWKLHTASSLGRKNPASITANEIIQYRKSLTNLSPKTIDEIIGRIGSVYRFCTVHDKERCGHLINPIDEVRVLDKNNITKEERLARKRRRERFLSLQEIEQLRKEVQDDLILAPLIELLLSTGVRIEGALNVRKRDVDLERGVISLIDLKSGNERYEGYITPQLKEHLSNVLENLQSNDFIISRDGNHLPYRTIQNWLKPILDKLFNTNLDKKDISQRIVIHSLRHTFASHLAIKGTPLNVIQKLMNHKEIETTMRYAKLLPDSGKESIVNLYS